MVGNKGIKYITWKISRTRKRRRKMEAFRLDTGDRTTTKGKRGGVDAMQGEGGGKKYLLP